MNLFKIYHLLDITLELKPRINDLSLLSFNDNMKNLFLAFRKFLNLQVFNFVQVYFLYLLIVNLKVN